MVGFKQKIITIFFIIVVVSVGASVFWCYISNNKVNKAPIISNDCLKDDENVKKQANKSGVTITDETATEIKEKILNARPDYSIIVKAEDIKTIAQKEQKENKSDWAPVVCEGTLSDLSGTQSVELKQYHIYTMPKILREIGIKADTDNPGIRGASYGIKRKLSEKGKYIGIRLEYDWKDRKAGIWGTYTY